MGELQKLWVTLGLKATEFSDGMKDAEGQVKGFGSRIQSGLGSALGKIGGIGQAAFLGVGAAAIGGFGMAMKSAIDMNASLETSTLQFTTLMGDADKAQEHVKGLFDFAAATPFESQQIIDASLKLQTFGGEALNTMENLQLVGDASAAVGAPIDEVSFWVGRLYSNLQAGQPFGEAAARLQEMGIMAPAARTELENMQASGASASDIFATFQGQLGTFTGAMETQAGTWQGLMSTIKDNLNMAMAEGLQPFFDLAKQGLEALAGWLSSPAVQQAIQDLAQRLRDVVTVIAEFVNEHVLPFVQKYGPELKGALIALAAAFGALMVIGAIVTLVGMLTNPITLIIAAVGLLGAAWAGNWGGIQDKTKAVIDFLTTFINAFLTKVRQWWEQHGEAIMTAAESAWTFIKDLVDFALKQIVGIFDAFKMLFQGDWEGFLTKIYQLWKASWDKTIEILTHLWEWIQPKLEAMWKGIQAWWSSIDWQALGRQIIDGIVWAIELTGTKIRDKLMDMAKAAWEAVKAFFQIGSPSQLMAYAGEMIVQGLIVGIQMTRDPLSNVLNDLVHDVEGMLKFGDAFGGIASGMAKRYKSEVLDPLKAEIERRNKYLAQQNLSDALRKYNINENDALVNQLQALRRAAIGAGDVGATALSENALGMLEQRNKLEEDYAKAQERVLALQKQQADLDFLKTQLDLLKLVADNKNILPKNILEGLKLGLNADAGNIMDSMTNIMQLLVKSASDALQIASPSRVFQKIGQYAMLGLASGLEKANPVEAALDAAMRPLTNAPAQRSEIYATRNQTTSKTTVNGGYNVYVYGSREPSLDELAVLAR